MNDSDALSALPGAVLQNGNDARDFLHQARDCDDVTEAKKWISRADEMLKELIRSAEAAVAEMEDDDGDDDA